MPQNVLRLVERDSVDKKKALDAALGQIERAFGKGSIMRLGEEQVVETEVVSTGSLGLDIALGIGGLPRGRVVEVYGPESSGKTTLALHVIAEAQKIGGTCAFVDAEHALDAVYAGKLGVDVEELLISQPDTGEQGLEIADTLVRSGAIDVLVIDSVAASGAARRTGRRHGRSAARPAGSPDEPGLRKLTSSISKSNTMVLFINQLRHKIGVMFGSPETTTGGNALKFYSSIRLDIRRIGAIKDRDLVVGNQTRVKVVKNKMAPPFRVVEFDIMYGEGVSKMGELLDLGVQAGIVEKSGAWFSCGSQRIGQGRENAKTFLKEHPEMAREIENKVRENAGLVAAEMLVEHGEDAAAEDRSRRARAPERRSVLGTHARTGGDRPDAPLTSGPSPAGAASNFEVGWGLMLKLRSGRTMQPPRPRVFFVWSPDLFGAGPWIVAARLRRRAFSR